MGLWVKGFRAWLDTSPLSEIALALMRDATGRQDPLEPLRPTRSVTLPVRTRLAFWSLSAGVGSSTTAALVAHRSGGAGRAPVLIDLDRWAPSLALRAQLQAATIADALLRPGRERESLSRWAGVPFLPGAPGLHAIFEAERILALVERLGADAPIVLDLGSGADALDPTLLGTFDRLCVVGGPRASHLQAAFCAVDLLRDAPCAVGFVTSQAADEDATRIASRLPWPLLASIPFDPYLADDGFAARAPTMAAVDRLIRAVS
jgi:MinD-like ATPase involved in chromosome partitioning or flagellar assembly